MSGLYNCIKHELVGVQSFIDKSLITCIERNIRVSAEDLRVVRVIFLTNDVDFPFFRVNYLFLNRTIEYFDLCEEYLFSENEGENVLKKLNDLSGTICVGCFNDYLETCNLFDAKKEFFTFTN